MQKNIFIFLALATFSGCATYNEKPIDLREDATPTAENSSETFPKTLGFEDALQAGLVLNFELNKARAQYALSKDVEKESGWWKDPSLSLEGVRQYDPSWQTNLAGGLAFTIPVTGLPGLEKEVAAHYREADYWKLVGAETDFRERLENDFSALAAIRQKISLARKRFSELENEVRQMDVLAQNGETAPAKHQTVSARRSAIATELQKLRADEIAQKLAIAEQIGIHPSVAGKIDFATAPATEIPENVSAPSAENLLALPKIREQLASYAASESELKTEIRRQYPEITLSPGFERDGDSDSTKMFSLGIGIDLPIWNRNRRAIAAAGGNREIKRIETIQLWRERFSPCANSKNAKHSRANTASRKRNLQKPERKIPSKSRARSNSAKRICPTFPKHARKRILRKRISQIPFSNCAKSRQNFARCPHVANFPTFPRNKKRLSKTQKIQQKFSKT